MNKKTENIDFKSHFLVRAARYELTAERPIYRGMIEEGNIALYGLILQANRDERLKQYLLDSSRDSLWEWQTGFGVTAEDSGLVIEGLLAAGVEHNILLPSLHRLVEIFYSPDEGAFRTILHGRAAYWRGPSVDATAHVGYLLQLIAPELYPDEIKAAADYLKNNQHKDGYWSGRWFPSTMITTYYAVRLLKQIEDRYRGELDRAKEYILWNQNRNGSWADSVIETSTAVLALEHLGSEEEIRGRAREWLLAQKRAESWQGEPVLYYWYETASGRKLFYHCADKGAVTTAWASLALKPD